MKKIILILVGLFYGIAEQGYCQGYQQSIDVRVQTKPNTVIINGKPTIYYELLVTNFSKDTLVVKSIDIVSNVDSTLLTRMSGDVLKSKFALIGSSSKVLNCALPAGGVGIFYIELDWENTKIFAKLFHTIEIQNNKGGSFKIHCGAIESTNEQPLIIGSPLSQGIWAAVYEPSWTRGHRRVIYTIDGKAHIPGRFAIDFIKLDDKGKYASGDENNVSNHYSYNENVLAVADGIVTSAVDTFSESKTLSDHPKYSPDKATGNFISLDIGNGYIVFYEHLKPMSVRVKPGQRVKKGDIIAGIGFTGQTTGPHLHFHVADKNSALGAEGVPFSFESFTLLGEYIKFEIFGKELWDNKTKRVVKNERPAPNTVLTFRD